MTYTVKCLNKNLIQIYKISYLLNIPGSESFGSCGMRKYNIVIKNKPSTIDAIAYNFQLQLVATVTGFSSSGIAPVK